MRPKDFERERKEWEEQVKKNGEIVVEGNEEPKQKVRLVDEQGKTADMKLGSMYDVNKDLVSMHEKPLSTYKLNNKIQRAISIFEPQHYYMLLNREKYDYTIFNFTGDATEAATALKDCILNRGECRGFHKTEEGNAYEIWIYDAVEKDSFVYYLFNCDMCIIKC